MPKKPRKKRSFPISKQRTKLLKGIAEGMNVSEAGRSAGYKHAQSAHRSLSLIGLKAPELLNAVGLSAEKVMKAVFVPAINAMETKLFAHEGVVVDSRDLINHDIRLRAGIELAKMHALYPKNGNGNGHDAIPAGNVTVNINLLKGSGDIIDVIPEVEVKS